MREFKQEHRDEEHEAGKEYYNPCLTSDMVDDRLKGDSRNPMRCPYTSM